MKLLARINNPQLLNGLYFLALISPVAAIDAPLVFVISQSYRGYLIFFTGFLFFVTAVRNKSASDLSIPIKQRIGQYLWLLLLGLAMIFGLGLLSIDQTKQLPLYLTLLTCTLHGLLYSKKVQKSAYRVAAANILFTTVLIFTGFSAIGFPAYYGSALYSLGLACTFTAPLLFRKLNEQISSTNLDQLEKRTRKQRRKIRNLINFLADSTTWRWFMIALLLLGPVILTTMSMTELFPAKYGIVILLALLARLLVQPLPVRGPVPNISEQLVRDWILFSYLFVLCIFLVRLVIPD